MTEGYQFEGLWRRFVAALIDNAGWLLFYFWFLSPVVAAAYDSDPEVAGIVVIVFISAWFNYFAVCEWRWGQTIGKNVMGMKVISIDRGRISFGQASIRNLLRIVDFFVIGWLMIAGSEMRQRLGDKAAKTVVVRSRFSEARNYSEVPISGGAPEPEAPESAESPGEAPAEGLEEAGAARDPGRLPEIDWGLGDTMRGLVGGLVLGIVTPILIVPFDADFDSDASKLAAQALFGLSLIGVAFGVATRWSFRGARDALAKLGLR